MKMTPNDILLLLRDQCLAHPSAEKLPPTTDGNKHRDLQLDNVHRMRELETVNTK